MALSHRITVLSRGKVMATLLRKETDPEKAKGIVEDMCKKLLANLVIENYKIIETQ